MNISIRLFQQRRTSGYQSACDKSRTGGLAPGNGKQNGLPEICFVYYQVTRGTGMRNHVFPEGKANLWIMLKPAEIADGHEAQLS